MLGILPARPADEAAAFGPGDPQLLGCLHSHTRALAVEELAPLPVGPASSIGTTGGLSGGPPQGGDPLRVDPAQFLEPERGDEGHRLVDRLGPSVLDQVLQLAPQAHGEPNARGRRLGRLPYEKPYGVGASVDLVRLLEPVESLDFLGC